MTTLGTGARFRSGRIARLVSTTHDGKTTPGGEHDAAPPYQLLWSVGIIALVLCVAAFALWGIYGANTLLDLIAALCV